MWDDKFASKVFQYISSVRPNWRDIVPVRKELTKGKIKFIPNDSDRVAEFGDVQGPWSNQSH
jgi:hypothetical protein